MNAAQRMLLCVHAVQSVRMCCEWCMLHAVSACFLPDILCSACNKCQQHPTELGGSGSSGCSSGRSSGGSKLAAAAGISLPLISV